MNTVYKYTYFTQMDSTHWLCYALDGTDMGEIYYSLQDWCYVYDQPTERTNSIEGLIEIFLFMSQL